MVKISIIIPVYNTRDFVGRCLESVLSQQNVDFECVVVDDCTPDGAMEEVEKFADPRIKIVRHSRNRGLAAARNSGAHAALFDWIFYLDSDDTMPQGALEALAAHASSEVDWVQGSFNRIAPEHTWQTIYPHWHYTAHTQIAVAYNRLNFTNSTNKLINIGRVNIPFREGLIFEDSLWCSQAYCSVNNIVAVETPTYNHILREGSIMRSSFTAAKIESLLYIVAQTAAMNPDKNLRQTTVYNALYLIKNLYASDFSRRYRKSAMRKLAATGVFRMRFNRRALPRFTRILSYGFHLPNLYFALMTRIYKSYKVISFIE